MCGRYVITSPLEAILRLFDAVERPNLAPRYNVAPTQDVPIVRARREAMDLGGRGRELALVRWGLIPHWAKDPGIGNRLINARGESVTQKPAFRDSFARRRCLVVADGFYEWRAGPGGKQPYLIRLKGGGLMVFAGLWAQWTPSEQSPGQPAGPPPDARPVETCTIVTTEANALVAPIHGRMPVIVPHDGYDAWISGPAEDAMALLRPYAPDAMEAFPVSRRVNNARVDEPDLVVPLAVQQSLL